MAGRPLGHLNPRLLVKPVKIRSLVSYFPVNVFVLIVADSILEVNSKDEKLFTVKELREARERVKWSSVYLCSIYTHYNTLL